MSVYTPRFVSRLRSTEKHASQPKQPTMNHTGSRCGNKRGRVNVDDHKTPFVLKVKLPIFNNRSMGKNGTREDETVEETPRRPMLTKTTMKKGETQGFGAESDSVCADVYLFPQEPTSKTTNEKEKAKLAVHRTISKMLEENQLIRQRLAKLNETN